MTLRKFPARLSQILAPVVLFSRPPAGAFMLGWKHSVGWDEGKDMKRRILIADEADLMLVGIQTILKDNPACRSEEHTSELQSRENLVCRLLLEKKKIKKSLTRRTADELVLSCHLRDG